MADIPFEHVGGLSLITKPSPMAMQSEDEKKAYARAYIHFLEIKRSYSPESARIRAVCSGWEFFVTRYFQVIGGGDFAVNQSFADRKRQELSRQYAEDLKRTRDRDESCLRMMWNLVVSMVKDHRLPRNQALADLLDASYPLLRR